MNKIINFFIYVNILDININKMSTRSKVKIEEKPIRKIGLPDPIGLKKTAKGRMQGACSLIPKGSRKKAFQNKELYDSKCEFCRKYGKDKKIPVCPVEGHDLNTGKPTIKRKGFCRSKPTVNEKNTVAYLRKEVKKEGKNITKDGKYLTKKQLKAKLSK